MDTNKIVQFVREQFNEPDSFIPLHAPSFIGNEKKYLNDAIDSTFVSSVGAYVDRFEREIEAYTGLSKAVAVVNGTNGLQVAMSLVGVERDTEVLTQSFTFVATANAIAYLGASPIFIDVDLDTMGLSPDALQDFLNEFGNKRSDGTYNKKTGKKITACMPMHTFGFICKIEEIVAICNEWQIPVVEDAAEALGSSYKGRPAGSFGTVGVYSFNGNKVITSGGGGVIVTNDEALGKKAKHLTTTAKVPHKWEYYHDQLGYNFRMPNLNAALACAQLEQLETYLADKRELAANYASFFKQEGIKFRVEDEHTIANYWLMCVEFDSVEQKEAFLTDTNSNGVMTRPAWQLMHRLPMYSHCQRDSQKNSEFLEARIVNVPSSPRNL